MKRLLLTLLAAAILGLPLSAQTYRTPGLTRFEASLATGGACLYDWLGFGTWGCCDGWDYDALESLYRTDEYKTFLIGPLRAQFFYNFNDTYAFGGTVSLSLVHGKLYEEYTRKDYHRFGGSFTLMPEVRRYHISHEQFRLYSAVGAGLYIGAYNKQVDVLPALQFVPLGFTLGRKVYWNMELGMGTYYYGFMTGVGYRF